ncbi:hypothetical protein J3R82DRAFT_11106 [Butyriboletus roseoflavus]|nr:hypothetical protein J3R82DRAFT_11106 [Butyriboletus roseoflavus]
MSEQRQTEAPSVHSSQAEVWYLKAIVFGSGESRRRLKIITQNFNGPCSFIAICNILILRGHIEILPHDRTTVSYEFLSQLVGEYLLTNCPDIDISSALSIMPSTTKGLDLNPQFTSVTAFSPASDTGELALFTQAGIQLVHGWVVDPESPEAETMAHIRDYDTAVTLIADADYITRGRLLSGGEDQREGEHEAGPSQVAGSSSSAAAGSSSGGGNAFMARQSATQYSDEDRRKIEHAIIAQQFLDATKSQLTYHGLFQLASTLRPGSLVALFRNAHLSVVYKSPGPGSVTPNADADTDTNTNTNSNANATEHTQDAALYALVTDDVFLHEPTIVWERLEDVDGGWSTFVNSEFHRAVPVGGDVAGQTAEAALRRFEMEAGLYAVVDPADQALARQLQAEEDQRAQQLYLRRQEALERRRAQEEERQKKGSKIKAKAAPGSKNKKMKNCVVM